MFCALESDCLRNLLQLCSCHFYIESASLASSVFQFEAAWAFDRKQFYFQDSMKESALCFAWKRGVRKPCVFLQHTEHKPSNLMGQICEFTPANSTFLDFLCPTSLFMPQRAACTFFTSPMRQAAQINRQFVLSGIKYLILQQ